MVKTHPYSRFTLKSLEEIRDTSDVILQIEQTRSTFTETKKDVYICEIVSSNMYNRAETVECLTGEIIKVNAENRRLHKKVKHLEKELLKN